MGLISLLVLIFASVTLSSHGGVAALCSSPYEAYCPPPWLAFQGHCYLWVDKPMSWMDSERYCRKLSHPGKMAHLASIHSKEEDEFIKTYAGKSSVDPPVSGYWIGYNDIEQEDRFQWSDGSDASYEGWDPREPRDIGGEDCVECRSEYAGMWNDVWCTINNPFVCKL
ncbi:lactose-binding lectin l-2-like [Patiria miniata]|uniref:C-type lectin domain-containing protein n=1 Tax=Patiria miniata TaxID=46514 RepID=A0A914A4P9_PATMI|nr:lactose-binding lectin l-2-like [Patiria miniata]